MSTTTHTVPNQSGCVEHVTVSHAREAAVQYDFYIPTEIWDAPAMQTFRTRLLAMDPGATEFNGLTGVWQGDTEETRIYRLILRASQFQRNNVTDALKQEVGVLMATLSLTAQRQEAFMYTETDIHMNMHT